MKMGVKEFRERFSDVAEGRERVFVTKNGRIVGQYDPVRSERFDRARWDEIDRRLKAFREDWKARTPDWRERLAAEGFGDDGELLNL